MDFTGSYGPFQRPDAEDGDPWLDQDSSQLRQRYQRLFQYDLWCIRTYLSLIEAEDPFPDRIACLAFLSHIVTVQEHWYMRMFGDSTEGLDVWVEYTGEQLRKKARSVHQRWLDLIGDHDTDIKATLVLTREDGSSQNITVLQVLDHVLVHGQYHLAQVSLFLKKSGVDAPSYDYAMYAKSLPDVRDESPGWWA